LYTGDSNILKAPALAGFRRYSAAHSLLERLDIERLKFATGATVNERSAKDYENLLPTS